MGRRAESKQKQSSASQEVVVVESPDRAGLARVRGLPRDWVQVQAEARQTGDDKLAVADKPHVYIQEPAKHDELDDADYDDDSDDAAFELFQGSRKTLLQSRARLLQAFQATSGRSNVIPVVPRKQACYSGIASARRQLQSPFHLWREMKAKIRAARSQNATDLSKLRKFAARQRGSLRTQFTRSLAGDDWMNTAEEPESQQPRKSTKVMGPEPSSPAHKVQDELNSNKHAQLARAKLARGMGIHAESIADAIEEFNRLEEVNGEAVLSKGDFFAILKRMGDLSTEDLEYMWIAADANNDGEVNWSEFLQWYKYHCWSPDLLS